MLTRHVRSNGIALSYAKLTLLCWVGWMGEELIRRFRNRRNVANRCTRRIFFQDAELF